MMTFIYEDGVSCNHVLHVDLFLVVKLVESLKSIKDLECIKYIFNIYVN